MQTESTDALPSTSLARRYFRQVAGLSVGLLLVAGATEAVFGYNEARQNMARVQALQAQVAAAEIEQYLQSIERLLRSVQGFPWGQSGFDIEQRRDELHRLIALSPSVIELIDLDAAGRELLAVSRLTPDRRDSGGFVASGRLGYGRPYFDDAGVPHVQLGLQRQGVPDGLTLARINLRFLVDVVSGLRVDDGGDVYVVDESDHLVAHADSTKLLQRRRLSTLGVVLAARAAGSQASAAVQAFDAPGLDGRDAVSTVVSLPDTGWLVVVEHSRTQAMQPVIATLQRTAWLLALAALFAMLVSAAFSRRMAAPIARLRQATADMAAGRLQQRLNVHTGDEIEGLADDFNALSAQLQRSYAELEQKVADRTAELALRRDEAERANAAKTRFIASASHDLRQPMHAIGLLVGVLQERLTDPIDRELADKTHAAVRAMDQLFGGLLDISKLDAGAVTVVPQRFALQSLLDRVCLTHGPLAAAKGLRLRARRSPLWLHTDPVLLERILGNLVANAIRYTARGGVLLGCRRRGSGMVLQVVDSGTGIAAEQLDRIFEEFVRLGSAQADQGLGLGLAIVRRTAVLLGLQVDVRSQPGRGSVFELALPVAAAQPVEPAPLAQQPDLRRAVAGAFVLVVDDDPRNRDATTRLLQQWGCLVASAPSAELALQEADRHLRSPDVLVTDLRLGHGADGLVLIRQLRAHTGQWLPALLITAELQVGASLDGDIRVLAKPTGAQRLLEALAQALSGHGG